jgi:hypothetical protein
MAVRAVLSEPLSGQIPWYQGLIQGFFMGFAEHALSVIRQSS